MEAELTIPKPEEETELVTYSVRSRKSWLFVYHYKEFEKLCLKKLLDKFGSNSDSHIVKQTLKKFDTFPYHVMMSEVYEKKGKPENHQRNELLKVRIFV